MWWKLILNSILLGVGLAMDACAVSMANGLNDPNMKVRKVVLVALIFAFFQALMPMIGWICVRTVAQQFDKFTVAIPYIALALLEFIGGKMIGVNSFSKNRTLAYYFADYISSYECQMQRFETLGMGPSNLHALEEEEVKANKALSGLAEQVGMAGDAQINVPSTFWSAVQNFGVAVGYQNKTGMTDAQLQSELDKLVEDITTLSSGN